MREAQLLAFATSSSAAVMPLSLTVAQERLGARPSTALFLAQIFGVDRILDMARTTVNVTGDLVACVVLDRWVGGEIEEPSPAAAPASATPAGPALSAS